MVEGKNLKAKVGKFVRAFESAELPRSRPRISREKSKKISRAVTGILGALVPQEALAGTVSSYTGKGKKPEGGRGRPHGTYKTRFVPGVGPVKVPTHIYRKMMSEVKAKRRLAQAKRQAGIQEQYEAEQIAMAQDPRFQQTGEDQFLDAPDMDHEARVASIRERQLYQQQVERLKRQPGQPTQQRANFITRAGEMFGRVGGGLLSPQQGRQQLPSQAEPYSVRQVPGIIHPQIDSNMFHRSEPQVIVTGGKSIMFQKKSNLLSQGNEFNRPEDSVLERGGVKRKRNHL